ncbi:ZIP family metal transporter [Methanobacterium sp. MBAC-LM]|uniref:ZIP family metal transporter n=1 Tax=Methanobacterium sp. MBAC-LM TaxID=3412034 RepID=UPI003C7178F0
MIELGNSNPIILTIIATIFTWLMTAFGASTVFITKNVGRKLIDASLGFAAGVMIAASFWSLLTPAIEMSSEWGYLTWIPAATGFLLGSIFLGGIDKIIPHLHMGCPIEESEGIKTMWHRNRLLILAVTLHNIPEGLAIGIAFGAVAAGFESTSLFIASTLAIGIGIQNVPEGMAVSLPLRSEGMSKIKSFWYGQLSGFVEVISGIIGVLIVSFLHSILPYALGFAAGAMIFVVVEDVIPECQRGKNTDLATLAIIGGFLLMMILDVTFS